MIRILKFGTSNLLNINEITKRIGNFFKLPIQLFTVSYPELALKQNPHTGKCFFVYGFETGAVSEKFLKGEISNPVISQVCSPEDGEMFFMLHEKGDGGAPVLATL